MRRAPVRRRRWQSPTFWWEGYTLGHPDDRVVILMVASAAGMPLGFIGLRIRRTNRIPRSRLEQRFAPVVWGASLNSPHPSNGSAKVLDLYSAQPQQPLELLKYGFD